MPCYLGVDVGSSKTHALITSESGTGLGFGQAGGGNHQGGGYDGLRETLQQSVQQACQHAGISPGEISGAGFGISGYDFPSDRAPHLEAIATLGLACPLEIVNDGVNGLLAGTSHGVGVNVTAGSSVNCRGRGPHGEEGRIVGNGARFGEFGGAGEIIARGLQMVNYAWIQRIPPTRLTGLYLQASGARNEIELMECLSDGSCGVTLELAIQVFELARAGDQAARDVIHWAGTELGLLAVSVIRQIGMEKEPVEVVQSGSVFEGGELINSPMRTAILEHVPRAVVKRLNAPPVVGPVLLGMQMAGVDGYTVRDRITQTAREMVKS